MASTTDCEPFLTGGIGSSFSSFIIQPFVRSLSGQVMIDFGAVYRSTRHGTINSTGVTMTHEHLYQQTSRTSWIALGSRRMCGSPSSHAVSVQSPSGRRATSLLRGRKRNLPSIYDMIGVAAAPKSWIAENCGSHAGGSRAQARRWLKTLRTSFRYLIATKATPVRPSAWTNSNRAIVNLQPVLGPRKVKSLALIRPTAMCDDRRQSPSDGVISTRRGWNAPTR
jgi:hypothetical protein